VGVPIAQKEKSSPMGVINLSLFRFTVRLVRIARANIGWPRSGGAYDCDRILGEAAE
jgi:hypothetical protein